MTKTTFVLVITVLFLALLPNALTGTVSSEPFKGEPTQLPGIIQAEDYDEGGELSAFGIIPGKVSDSMAYRFDGVSIHNAADVGGGFNVAGMKKGEWLAYTVTVAQEGIYHLAVRAASVTDGAFRLSVGDRNCFETQEFIASGCAQVWKTVNVPLVHLPEGTYTLRFTALSDDLNINWLSVTTAAQTPYGGVPQHIPGTVEAEKYDNGGQYVAYYDTTPGNICYYAAFRFQDVDVENNPVNPTITNVGWIATGEWLEYTIDAGVTQLYRINIHAACPTGGKVTISFDGGGSRTKTIAPTGLTNQDYRYYYMGDIYLTQGQHVMKVSMGQSLWNFNNVMLIPYPPFPINQIEKTPELLKSPPDRREPIVQ